MGTVATPPPQSGLSSESLPHIDIRKLSQSELYALSTCSDFAFDLRRTNDVVSPNIDRANFNESAGSRRQTYSLHRDNHHHRRNRLLSAAIQPPASDPEDRSILHFLKHYVNHNSTATAPPPPPPPPSPVTGDRRRQLALAVHVAGKKRKRTQKTGRIVPRNALQLQRVNKEGNEVDFAALDSNGDDLYADELGKWTAGFQTEDELLEFMSSLEGQWGSTRKRRKYVDASKFGAALPVGWKLLLGLKRRSGSVWLYCRRLLSPTGEQFLSCKEAASFLRSYFDAKASKQPVDRQICLGAMVSENGADFVAQDGSGLAPSFSLVRVGDGKEAYLADIDNLHEVLIRDLFECNSCKLAFDEKNVYLQHLMSVHQQTTRRFNFGGTVSGGFIGNGTYECQFCHKIFREKNDYNGHVAVHNVHPRKDTGTSEAKLVSDDVQKIRESPSKHGNDCIMAYGKTVDIDGQETLETNRNEICVPFTELLNTKELQGEKSFGCRSSEISVAAANKVLPNDENLVPTGNVSTPVSMSNKGGGNESCVDSQKLRNSSGFEELELDEMEYCFVDGNRGPDLARDTQESTPSVGSDSKDAQMKMKEFTTVCVWCRSEFQIEKAFEPEMPLDSIGYMCAKCKDNISGQFNRICS